MTERLTADGYDQTKEKLHYLETRLVELDKRMDLHPEHLAGVRSSYRMMMEQFLREIKLYEANRDK